VPYRNPVITCKFDHLVDDGDTCNVVIRNPQTLPSSQFSAMTEGGDAESDGGKMTRVHGMIAGMVIGWRVWDTTVPVKATETGELIHDAETEPRLLPLPATAESVAKLPPEILKTLMSKVTDAVNPPQIPAETTGTTS
jgi:hypothetical protein